MRWRLLGLLFFAAAGAVGWVFWLRPEAELWLKVKLETVLSEQLGQDVRLGSLSIHPLLLRVVAEEVRVGPSQDPLFTCQRWTFYTATAAESNPFSFFRLTLSRSEVDRATLRWPAPGDHPFQISLQKLNALPFHQLTWKNASVLVPLGPQDPVLSINQFQGVLEITPLGVYLSVGGNSSIGKFMAKGRGTISFKGGFRSLDVYGGATLDKVPLEFISARIPARYGRWLGTGFLFGDVSIKGFRGDSFALKDLNWTAGATLSKAIWFPPTSLPKDRGIPVEGPVGFKDGRVHFNSLRFFNSLEVSGSVAMDPKGDWDVSWKGTGIPLGDVAESGVHILRSLPSKGIVGTEGKITGTLAHPEVEWTANLKGVGYPGFLLPDVAMGGQWKDNWFSLKTEGISGQLAISGTLPPPGASFPTGGRVWTVRASNLDLESLAKQNGWIRVRGLMNGSLSFVGPAGGPHSLPEADGTLRIDDFAWGIHQETAPVLGRLTLDRHGFRVQGEQKTFDLEIQRSTGVWRVDQLLYEAGDLRLWGRGYLMDENGQMQLEGGVSGFPLADVPPLAKRFPAVEGRVSTEGRLHGRWNDPVFSGTILVEGARWRPGGRLHRGAADFRGGRGGFSVSRFQWDEHVRGEGTWLFGKGGRLTAEVDKASGDALFDFFTGSDSVHGIYSGKVSLASGDQPGWEGWARFSGEKGGWGTTAFDQAKGVLYFRGPRIDLESLEFTQKNRAIDPVDGDTLQAGESRLNQKDGVFRATGEARLRPIDPASPGAVWDWRLAGELSHFVTGSLGVSAAWTAHGHRRSREGTGAGFLHASTVTLHRLGDSSEPIARLGDMTARLSWSPTLWRVEDFSMDQGVRAQVEMDQGTQGLVGQVQMTDLSPSAIFPGLSSGAEVRFGRVNGTGALSGTWASPRGDLSMVFSGAGWKDFDLEGETQAVWNGSGAIPRLSFALKDRSGQWKGQLSGGLEADPQGKKLTLDGQLQRGDQSPYSWEGKFLVVGSTVSVQEAVLLTSEGRWNLRPGSTFSHGNNGAWTFHLKNDLRNIHLGPLQLFGGLSLDGKWMPQDRAVTGRIGAESLWINQRFLDQDMAEVRMSTEAVTFVPMAGVRSFVQGRVRLHRWPQIFFENLTLWDSGQRRMVLAGELGPAQWDFSLQGWGLQAETLLTLADFDWPIIGPWTVKVRGKGSLQEPEVQAEISGGPGRIGPLPYDRLEAQAHWEGEWVKIRDVRLSKRKGYLLTGDGRFPVRKRNEEDPSVVSETEFNFLLAEGNLAVLKDVWPLCRSARGSFSGDVRMEPAKPFPRVTGAFQLQDGRMDLESYAPKVRDLNAALTFQNDRMRVEHARARVGSGWIEMAGDMTLHGLSPVEYDLAIQSDGKRGVSVEVPQLSVPPGPLLGHFSFFSEKLKGISYGEPRVSLRVKGIHGQHVISGTAVLEETHFTYPPAKDGFSAIPGPSWWRNFWRLAGWDIRFKTGKETWYRNEYLNVRLDGGLHLVGHSGSWALNGRVGSTEGVINYLGQLFQVQRGDFEVVTEERPALGASGILPYVSGEAERVVTTVDPRGLSTDDTISMVVDRALLGEIQPRFVSRNNPDLASDRVAMKALGLSSEQQGTPADRDQLFRAGLVQLVGSSAAPLANRLAQKFGIGMISPIYEPPETQETAPTGAPAATPKNGQATNASPLTDYLRGAGASARIRLTDRLSGVYKVKLDEAKNQTYFRDQIELILRVKGSLFVRASSELDSQSLLGQPPERRAVLENQWRFGLPKRKKKEVSEPMK